MDKKLELDLDLSDEEIFGNEAGEDEDPEILSTYFITKKKFNKFLSKSKKFGIARAKKGMGKSSLLSKLAFDVNKDDNNIVITVTGSDLLSFGTFNENDHLKLQNEWKTALSARINYELGNKIGFAWTDDQMALVEASELSGFKGKNLVGSLLQRIKSKHIPIESKKQGIDNPSVLLERYMNSDKDFNIWIFIDDIDSTFSADEIQKARVSSFFSACRSLTRDINGLFIRASVRTDVWTTIRYNEDLDKCEQYSIDITWTKSELEKIISKKILSYINRNHNNTITSDWDVGNPSIRHLLIAYIFENTLPWNKSRVSPFVPLRILGAKRPRWISQLCRLSAEAASDREIKRVTMQDINFILTDYGRLRVNDLYKEHNHQFAELQKLIETFSRGQERYKTSDLLLKIEDGFVQRIGEATIGMIDGETYSKPLQLAHLLFRIGFIQLRDKPSPDSPPNFIDYGERPELLTDSTFDYNNYIWEIHPSYRGVLNIGHANKAE